jgi:TetR/AcrR family transcriptional regulator, transcriptional repressor for nem operon
MRISRSLPDTSKRILDVAEKLVQTRGFNGFSYADVATALGITKASLHYHFPTKADLGLRLIARYHDEFLAALAAIDADGAEPGQKLRQYGQLYAEVLRRQSMCLCGMLAADYATLPKPMRQAVLGFFDANERWLSKVLEEGRAGRSLRFDGPAPERARMILAALEGAMLVARSYGDVGRFSGTAELVFGSLS